MTERMWTHCLGPASEALRQECLQARKTRLRGSLTLCLLTCHAMQRLASKRLRLSQPGRDPSDQVVVRLRSRKVHSLGKQDMAYKRANQSFATMGMSKLSHGRHCHGVHA